MLVLRSLLFNVAFYALTILWLIGLIPFVLLPRKIFLRAVQAWGRASIWLLRVVAGTRLEFRGVERIPSGGLLVASKHQSMLETFALVTMFDDPTFVLKRELRWIPFFGWYTVKAAQVPVDRSAGAAALSDMNERARKEAARGRQIVIFPEGTRRAAAAPQLPAPARHRGDRVPRSDPARPLPRRLLRGGEAPHRNRLRPPRRRRLARALERGGGRGREGRKSRRLVRDSPTSRTSR